MPGLGAEHESPGPKGIAPSPGKAHVEVNAEVRGRKGRTCNGTTSYHGDRQEAWEAAKAEARDAMVAVAARCRLIPYSDLVAEIRGAGLEP